VNVLVITRSDDNDCVRRVIGALERRGHVGIRLDTDRFPDLVRISTRIPGGADGAARVTRTLTTPTHTVALEDIGSVWYRRFAAGLALPPSLGDMLGPSVDEARRSLYGTISALAVKHIDRLEDVRRCDHKERQLIRARALGLDVPRTLFTNDPAEARAFHAACDGRIVTKSQSSWAINRDGRELVVFTSVVDDDALADLDGLRLCPMTFQEHLPKAFEFRSVVVGDRVLSARVDSQALADARVDWRKQGVALLHAWQHYALPRDVERALLALVREFGLTYSAADFVVTPDGRHVFLEINAGGEWLWLDDTPGLGIADAIAAELTRA
jgi:hypothetical protein